MPTVRLHVDGGKPFLRRNINVNVNFAGIKGVASDASFQETAYSPKGAKCTLGSSWNSQPSLARDHTRREEQSVGDGESIYQSGVDSGLSCHFFISHSPWRAELPKSLHLMTHISWGASERAVTNTVFSFCWLGFYT